MNIESTQSMPSGAMPDIRSAHGTRGVEWLVGAARLFAKTPVNWALTTLILIVVGTLLCMLGPAWCGSALAALLGTVVVGRLMHTCQALDGVRATAAHPEGGATAALWSLGLIAAIMCISLSLILVLMGASNVVLSLAYPTALLQVLGWKLALVAVLALLMSMALWLAPALVVLQGVAPVRAIRMSFAATLRNLLPYLVYNLLLMLLCIAAAVPFFAGMLVVIPMLFCGSYLAYKDLFLTA
jgi:hypothetical protein